MYPKSERVEQRIQWTDMAAPQGFEPQYAGSEPAVLPLNEGAVQGMRAEEKHPY